MTNRQTFALANPCHVPKACADTKYRKLWPHWSVVLTVNH